MSTEHPILFSGPLVRAILDGHKTQTRRLISARALAAFEPATVARMKGHSGEGWYAWNDSYRDEGAALIRCPYGAPGDRLWVRECYGHGPGGQGDVRYRADGGTISGRWVPSIHMPRWASRLSLEVTEVRVQRLQDITEDDAQAEGVVPPDVHAAMTQVLENPADNGAFHCKAFRAVWDSLDPGGWDRNPWVWAVTFRRVQG